MIISEEGNKINIIVTFSVSQDDRATLLDRIDIKEIPREELYLLSRLNREIFEHEYFIRMKHPKDLLILSAWLGGELVGFKIGYAHSNTRFYSAKGCTHPDFRRIGIARKLLWRMIVETTRKGYKDLVFDTFPELFSGMYELGISAGFAVLERKHNASFKAEQVRLIKKLQ